MGASRLGWGLGWRDAQQYSARGWEQCRVRVLTGAKLIEEAGEEVEGLVLCMRVCVGGGQRLVGQGYATKGQMVIPFHQG